jgi:hypothetical protein
MRKSSTIIVCMFFFVLPLLYSPSLFAQEESWPLVGAWINKDYDISGKFSAKVVYGGDGSLKTYRHLSDTSAAADLTFTVEESWTEKGIRWFKVKIPFGSGTMYEIDKLTEGGNTYESVFGTDKYPLSFDPKSPSYMYTIRYRE